MRGIFLRMASTVLGTILLISCSTTRSEHHYNLAVDHVIQGRLDEGEQEYRRAIKKDPGLHQAHNNLGSLYLKQGLLHEAEREFKAAISIKKDYLFALENLASTYEAMGGKEREALETWITALELESRPYYNIQIADRVVALQARLSPSSELPVLAISSPMPGQSSAHRVKVEGEVKSGVGIDRVAIWVNGQSAVEGARGIGGTGPGKIQEAGQPFRFEQEVTLKAGENQIAVIAYDIKGNSTARVIRLSRTLEGIRYYAKSWGIVIGINDYERWPGLEYAVNDANSMAAKLQDMGFDEVIKVVDQEATRERIMSLLGTELPKKVGKDDRVFFFFAGHGQTEELPGGRQKGYIIPVDGSLTDYFTTAISMEQVREFSERISAKHIYYAIDACYSGLGFTRAGGINPTAPNYLEKITELRSVQMVTAGGKGEQAVERGGHGVFTEYLLRGLDGEADLDTDGVVTATELGAFLRPQVTMASGNRQTPQYGRLDGEGEVVFVPMTRGK